MLVIDETFVQWYINEDMTALKQSMLNKINSIAKTVEHDLKTPYRPYATRVLLLKENILPMPTIVESDIDRYCNRHGLNITDLYPTDAIITHLNKLIEREFYGLKDF